MRTFLTITLLSLALAACGANPNKLTSDGRFLTAKAAHGLNSFYTSASPAAVGFAIPICPDGREVGRTPDTYRTCDPNRP